MHTAQWRFTLPWGRGCTPCSCFSACLGDTGYTERNWISSFRASTASFPSLSVSRRVLRATTCAHTRKERGRSFVVRSEKLGKKVPVSRSFPKRVTTTRAPPRTYGPQTHVHRPPHSLPFPQHDRPITPHPQTKRFRQTNSALDKHRGENSLRSQDDPEAPCRRGRCSGRRRQLRAHGGAPPPRAQ